MTIFLPDQLPCNECMRPDSTYFKVRTLEKENHKADNEDVAWPLPKQTTTMHPDVTYFSVML